MKRTTAAKGMSLELMEALKKLVDNRRIEHDGKETQPRR